jgi:hypothetical protein
VLLTVLTIAGADHLGAHSSPVQRWKVRAAVADANLKTLAGLDSFAAAGGARAGLRCEAMLEAAFARHGDPASPVHQVLPGGLQVFKIVLDGGQRGVFDLSYFYGADGSRLIAAQVLSVPRSWVVAQAAGRTRTLLLATDGDAEQPGGCVVALSLQDPLLSYVVPSMRGGPERPAPSRSRPLIIAAGPHIATGTP